MRWLADTIDPGHTFFRPCPECGAKSIGRDATNREGDGYYCDNCSYAPSKDEVVKSPFELLEGIFGEPASEPSISEITDSELQDRVSDKLREGWQLEEVTDNGATVLLSQTTGASFLAHTLVFIISFWWTLGIGNYVLHKIERKRNLEEQVIRADNSRPAPEPQSAAQPSDRLRELKELHDDGIITQEEYEQKREEAVRRL